MPTARAITPWLVLSLSLANLSCDKQDDLDVLPTPDAGPGGAGCLERCGNLCCEEGQVCVEGVCVPRCQPSCEGKECGSDGCDGSCGSCEPGFHCEEHRCVRDCVPEETEEQACDRLELECGTFLTVDSCGEPWTLHCGACTHPATCEENACVCPAESKAEFCARLGVECGPVDGPDLCGAPRHEEECGPCPDNRPCEAGICCVPENDAALCEALGKNCGQLEAVDRCGPRLLDCGTCPEPLTCGVNNICSDSRPSNDTCSNPERLVFGADGVAAAVGDTGTATDGDGYPPCSTSTVKAADVVYVFEVTERSTFEATVVPAPGSSLRPVLHLRTECAAGPVPGACNLASVDGEPVSLVVRELTPGTYYLWVDGAAQNCCNNLYHLTAKLREVEPAPINDVCAGVETIALDTNPVLVTGDTTFAVSDGGSCGSTALDGPDVLWHFALAEGAGVQIRVLPEPGSRGYAPAIRLGRGCEGSDLADEIGCATSSVGGTPDLAFPVLAAGDYYIAVDGTRGSYGAFTLEIKTFPPIWHDVCESALDIVLDEEGEATIVDNTAIATHHDNGSCETSYQGRDLVYRLQFEGTKNIEIQLTPDPGSTSYRRVLYIRTSCDPSAEELACLLAPVAGEPMRLTRSLVPGGTYYLFVDSNSSGKHGPFELHVSVKDPPEPPPHDVCAGAVHLGRLDPQGDPIVRADETTWSLDQYTGTCATTDGPDLVYTFELAEDAMVLARVQRDAADMAYRPAAYVRADCPGASPAPDLGCDTFVDPRDVEIGEPHDGYHNTGWAGALVPVLPRGTYYLVIDGARASAGQFTLTLTAGPPRLGETCDQPYPVLLGDGGTVEIHGDASFGYDDIPDVNPDASTCSGGSGIDLIYAVTTNTVSTLSFTLTAQQGTAWTLSMRSDCQDKTTQLPLSCQYISYWKEQVTITVPRVERGTTYLIVDGFAYSEQGPFTLTITATPIDVAHDTCAGAKELVFGPDGTVREQGDTRMALNDYEPKCGSLRADGPEFVYFVRLDQPSRLKVSLTPAATVYLRTECEGTTPFDVVACVSGSSGSTLVAPPTLPAGVYYLFVDDTLGGAGPFTLDVSVADTCYRASPLQFDDLGEATIRGDTTGAPNDNEGVTCGNSNESAEVVYAFQTTAEMDFEATAKPDGSGYQAYIYLREGCEPTGELACSFGTSLTGATARIVVNGLKPGDYRFFVDSYASNTGKYEVQAKLVPARPRPQGDTCEDAVSLSKQEGGFAEVTGDTSTALDNYRSSLCFNAGLPFNGPDLVYAFVLDEPSKVTATMTRTDGTSRGAISLRRSCLPDPADEIACQSNTNLSRSDASVTAALEDGIYFVIVDGVQSTAAPFKLKVDASPLVPGDTCAHALPLPTTMPFAGNTDGAVNSTRGTCTNNSVGDVVYYFTLGAPRDLSVSVRALSGGDFRPFIYLRSDCEVPESELACAYKTAAGDQATFTVNRLPQGTYYLWIDNYGSTASSTYSGPFEAMVTFTEPPAAPLNDVCAGAQSIPLTAGTDTDGTPIAFGEVSGDTAAATNDYTAAGSLCGGTSVTTPLWGNDLVYSFRLTAPARVTAKLESLSGTAYAPALILRKQCADPSPENEEACRRASPAEIVTTLDAGEHFAIVDGAQGTSGQFKLTIVARYSVLAADNCFNAQELVLDQNLVATATGDTRQALAEAVGGLCAGANADRPDLVYSITLRERMSLEVTATPLGEGTTSKPFIYVRTVCNVRGSELPGGCIYPIYVEPQTIRMPVLDVGTYYIWVKDMDTYSTYGPISLQVKAERVPDNDSCATAAPLHFDETTGGAIDISDTVFGKADQTGTCAEADGREVVYRFTTNSASRLAVTVTRSFEAPEYEPVVYLRSDCESGLPAAEAACASNEFGRARFEVPSLPAGTWYLIVDGMGGSHGPFRLEAWLTAAEGP